MGTTSSNIGAARRRLQLEALTGTPDDAGGTVQGFAPVAVIWAAVRWRSGDERLRADRTEQAARFEITIRWRAGVTAGMRFTGGGATYGILSAGDPVGDRTRLLCLCEEISP